MTAATIAAEVVRREKERRAELAVAIAAVVVFAKDGETSPAALCRHLRMYYGEELASSATAAELCAGVAVAGGVICDSENNQARRVFLHVKLRPPLRAERKRVADKWNRELPPGELPMIRRPSDGAFTGNAPTSERHAIDRRPGDLYVSFGVHRQVPDPDAITAWRTGGAGKGKPRGEVARRRRFPDYIARLSKHLDSGALISAVDRQLIELVTEGKSLQWIADELQMTKANVHKRVAAVRKVAGIAGPGPGR